MASEHQVIEFVVADFIGKWDRFFGTTAVLYKALSENRLLVVKEVPGTGTALTYFFSLNEGDEVAVVGDVIHIPARCVGSKPGNAVECRG